MPGFRRLNGNSFIFQEIPARYVFSFLPVFLAQDIFLNLFRFCVSKLSEKGGKNEKDIFISHGFNFFSFLIFGRMYNACSFTTVKSHSNTRHAAQGCLGKRTLETQTRQVDMDTRTLEKGSPLVRLMNKS